MKARALVDRRRTSFRRFQRVAFSYERVGCLAIARSRVDLL